MSTFNARTAIMARQKPSLSDVIMALRAHKHWVARFEQYIQGEGAGNLDPDVIGDEYSCSVGRWLRDTCALHYSHLPVMHGLIDTNKRLHFTSRHILLRYYDGEHEEALACLREGAFMHFSNLLKHQLGELAGYIDNEHHGMASSMALAEIFNTIHD